MEDEHKIDFLDPGTIMFFIMGVVSDFLFLGLLGVLIPGIGLAIGAFVIGAHYFFGLIVFVFFLSKTHGWLPKVILLLAWILPLPLLTIGLVLAIIGSNKIGALIIETVAIQVIAVATGGGGELLEAGAVGAEGVEVAATGAEAIGTAVQGVEEVAAAGETIGEVGSAAGELGEGANAVDLEPDIEKNPLDVEQRELLEEGPGEEAQPEEETEPEPEEETRQQKIKKRVEKVRDILDRTNQDEGDSDKDEDDQDEDYPKAA